MLMLVCKETPEKGRRCKVSVCEERIMGLSVLRLMLFVPEKARERGLAKGIGKLISCIDRYPAAKLVFKDDFEYKDDILRAGFKEADTSYILRQKSWEIALGSTSGRERVFVALKNLGAAERECLDRLCQKFRYMVLSAPDDIFAAASKRLAVYGVSPIAALPGITEADSAVLFSEPVSCAYFTDSCAVFPLAGDRGFFGGKQVKKVDFLYPEDFADAVPKGYSVPIVASYCAEFGVLSSKLINIAGVSF